MAGGTVKKECNFQVTAAQTAASLMTLACISECFLGFTRLFLVLTVKKALVIPAAYFWSQTTGDRGLDLHVTGDQSGAVESYKSGLLIISRGTAIMLLFVYAAYLFFQLKTHAFLFKPKSRRPTQDQDGENQERVEVEPEEEVEVLEMAPLAAGVALLLVTVVTSFAAEYRE